MDEMVQTLIGADGKRVYPRTWYPVGAIYISTDATSPAGLFGGTWEQIKDTFFLAAGDTYAAGSTGGEATHTLSENEMPSHYHSIQNTGVARFTPASSSGYWCWFNASGYNQAVSYNTGGSGAHNNILKRGISSRNESSWRIMMRLKRWRKCRTTR